MQREGFLLSKLVSLITFSAFFFILSGCGKSTGVAPSVLETVSGSLSFSSGIIYDFGSTQAGQILQSTIQITPVGGTVTNLVPTISLPFKFKGGAYPGVGGTCGTTISATCSIVLNFEPSSASSFSQNLNFAYKVGAKAGNSTLALTGQASLPNPTDLLITGPSTIERNQCVPFVLNSIIQPGINSPVTASSTVNLAVNSGSGAFYSDVTCSLSITSKVISSGSSTATVYFKGPTAPQTPTLVASASSLQSGTKVISVASTPTKLSLTVPAQIQINDCRQLSVARLDSSNIAVSSLSTINVNLSSTGSALLYSDSACSQPASSVQIASGTSSTAFYVVNAVAESFNVTASDQAAVLTSSTKSINSLTSVQWWNTAYLNRIQIILDNSDQAVSFSNQAVLIKLNSNVAAYSNFKSDGSDIRFIAADHVTNIDYEIEKWDVNGNSFIWVKIPSVPASSALTFYMYFNNSAAANGENANSVWSRYSSVWHLKEDATGVAPQFKDSAAAGKNGTAVNGPTTVPGIIGNALDFSGSYDSMDVGSLNSTLGATASLSFWLKTAQLGNNTNYTAPGVTGVEQAAGVNDIFWGWIDATGYIAVTAGNGTGAKSNLAINDNVWRHISITRNAANGNVSFYVNGVLNNSGTSGTGSITTTFSKFGVIPSTANAGYDLNGTLDEIRITASVMSDNDVKADFKFQNNSQLTYGTVETSP
jgi:hypothetical protein